MSAVSYFAPISRMRDRGFSSRQRAARPAGTRWFSRVGTDELPSRDLSLLACLMGAVALAITAVAMFGIGLDPAQPYQTQLETQSEQWRAEQAEQAAVRDQQRNESRVYEVVNAVMANR